MNNIYLERLLNSDYFCLYFKDGKLSYTFQTRSIHLDVWNKNYGTSVKERQLIYTIRDRRENSIYSDYESVLICKSQRIAISKLYLLIDIVRLMSVNQVSVDFLGVKK